MSNSIIPFAYEGDNIRVIERDGEVLFVAADVCRALDISNPSQAMTRLDDDERTLISNEGREINAVNEPGLYALIGSSRKPEAKLFKRWINHEVIPSIRKTGSYGQPAQLTGPELMAAALIEAQATLEAATKKVAELEPPAKAWRELSCATGDFVIADAAKIVARAGCDTGPKKLHDKIEHEWNWLFRRGEKRKRVVNQTAINRGWMVARITSGYFDQITGERKLGTPEPRVTVKGVGEIARRLGGDPDAAMEVAREAIHEQEAEVTA